MARLRHITGWDLEIDGVPGVVEAGAEFDEPEGSNLREQTDNYELVEDVVEIKKESKP